jgi:hypothetical protein
VSSTDSNAAVAAARTISLTGSGFMSGHMSARARIRGTGTLGAHWVSDSRLGCKLALSSASTQASLSVSMGTHAFAWPSFAPRQFLALHTSVLGCTVASGRSWGVS